MIPSDDFLAKTKLENQSRSVAPRAERVGSGLEGWYQDTLAVVALASIVAGAAFVREEWILEYTN